MRIAVIGLAAVPLALAACSVHVHPGSWTVSGGNTVQGSSKRVSEERSVSAFHGVEFGGSGSVRVKVGVPQEVTVEIDDNLLKQVKTTVENGVLHVGVEGSFRSDKGLRVTIQVSSLDTIDMSGSGSAVVEGLKGESFDADLSGSGRIEAAGSVSRVKADISGSGEANLTGLHARSADVTISGSGSASVDATDSVRANISGSGSISYSGSPRNVEKNISGSGRVSPGG